MERVSSSTVLFVSILLMLIPICKTNAQKTPVYSAEESIYHIGEFATVRGKVYAVSESNKGNIFLNLEGNDPNQKFQGMIFVSYKANFPNILSYEGKIVEITGLIELDGDKPLIILKSQNQIKIKGY